MKTSLFQSVAVIPQPAFSMKSNAALSRDGGRAATLRILIESFDSAFVNS
jgi:hypothetical protein